MNEWILMAKPVMNGRSFCAWNLHSIYIWLRMPTKTYLTVIWIGIEIQKL